MTKQQTIAASALQALLAHAEPTSRRASLAVAAVEYSDALLGITDTGADPISAREEIAAQALQALILKDRFQESSRRGVLAQESVDIADALIALT